MCNEKVGKSGFVQLSPEARKMLEDQIWKPGEEIPDISEFERSKVRRDIEAILRDRNKE